MTVCAASRSRACPAASGPRPPMPALDAEGRAAGGGDGAAARKRWMGLLARAGGERLEQAWRALPDKPGFTHLCPPEVGMVMVRARAGGVGQRFNMGEMTVSRCAVRLADGATGFGYVAGSDKRHAELAALFDALMHTSAAGALTAGLLAALADEQEAARAARAAKVAATRVDFFTMVRGDD